MMYDGLISDYSMWSGIPRDVVEDNVKRARQINATDYYTHTSEEEFYTGSRTYIYDLIGASDTPKHVEDKLEKFMPGIINQIKYKHGRLLDFGGGTGLFCEWAVRNTQMQVTYCDLPGYISSFAEWRFLKYKMPVEIVHAGMTDFDLPNTYDVIFSDAVWEHLDPEMQLRYAEKLPSYLNAGGVFVLLIDLAGESAEMPMHYNVDIMKVHNTIEKTNTCIAGKYNFISIWRKE